MRSLLALILALPLPLAPGCATPGGSEGDDSSGGGLTFRPAEEPPPSVTQPTRAQAAQRRVSRDAHHLRRAAD